VAIDAQSVGIASTPALTVGTAKAGTQIVATVNVTTALGALTLKASSVTNGGILDVQIINAAGDTFDSVSVNVYAYVADPPTSLLTAGRGGQAGF
jgi:hypothetical protein